MEDSILEFGSWLCNLGEGLRKWAVTLDWPLSRSRSNPMSEGSLEGAECVIIDKAAATPPESQDEWKFDILWVAQ